MLKKHTFDAEKAVFAGIYAKNMLKYAKKTQMMTSAHLWDCSNFSVELIFVKF